jgi:hypothetical protein
MGLGWQWENPQSLNNNKTRWLWEKTQNIKQKNTQKDKKKTNFLT